MTGHKKRTGITLLAVVALVSIYKLVFGSAQHDGFLPLQVNTGDMFGSSIATDGNIAVVSSMKASVMRGLTTATNAGIATVFEFSNGSWREVQTLHADDASKNDNFGFSVAIDSGVIVVGSWHSDIKNYPDAGAAYVFQQTGAQWEQVQKLTSPILQEKAHFGVSVDVHENLIVVGAQKHDLSAEVTDSGMAFIFSDESGVWKTVAEIEPENPSVGQLFGRSVATQNDYVFVGAPKTLVQGKRNAGAVYSYTRTPNASWQFHQLVTTETGSANSLFGESLDVENDTLVVGAWHDDEAGENAGAVFMYSLITDQWQQSHKVMAPDASDGNKFGFRIDLKKQKLLVGSHSSSSWLYENSGAAYLFSKEDEKWLLTNKYVPSRSKANAEFGRSVGLADTFVLVGAEKSNFSKPLGGDTYSFFLDAGVE
jgi:hypothetical protein